MTDNNEITTGAESAGSLPARDGAAARLAHLMHERGLSASIRPIGRHALVLTIRNPTVPAARLTQKIAVVPGKNNGDGGMFLWLFEGRPRGTWDAEPLGPASDVEAAADRITRVLSLAEPADAPR